MSAPRAQAGLFLFAVEAVGIHRCFSVRYSTVFQKGAALPAVAKGAFFFLGGGGCCGRGSTGVTWGDGCGFWCIAAGGLDGDLLAFAWAGGILKNGFAIRPSAFVDGPCWRGGRDGGDQ